MKSESTHMFALAVLLISSGAQSGGQERQRPATLALDKLEPHNVKAEPLTYLAIPVRRVWMMLAGSPSFQEAPFKMARLK
jgi:hypothetical protein